MLSYALKIVWFSLSLSGLLSCWLILQAFAETVQSYWAALLYCLGCTILQGIFCLGMIWRMDPFLMPKGFCVAQTIVIGFASFLLTGICASLTVSTFLAIVGEKRLTSPSAIPFKWRPIYLIPLVILPLAASAAQISVILTQDAVVPTDDLHCDATNPIWVRLLGYAGIPVLVSIPCLLASLVSIQRVVKTPRRIKLPYGNVQEHPPSPYTDLPQRQRSLRRKAPTPIQPVVYAIPSPTPSNDYAAPTSPRRAAIRPGFVSPVLSARQFHLPFSPLPDADFGTRQGFASSQSSTTAPDLDDTDSHVSSAFPTFAGGNGEVSPWASRDIDRTPTPQSYAMEHQVHDWRHLAAAESPRAARPKDSPLHWSMSPADYDAYVEDTIRHSKASGDYYVVPDSLSTTAYPDTYRNLYPTENYSPSSPVGMAAGRSHQTPFIPQNLLPHVWRILIFQLMFTIVCTLASVSTLIDVILRRSQPTPFGTQHVALLLTAWGPVVVFGRLSFIERFFFRGSDSR